MRWRVETEKEKWDRLESWQPWFAWFPVTSEDGHWLWLETVERRFQRPRYHNGMVASYPNAKVEYRPRHSLTVKSR